MTNNKTLVELCTASIVNLVKAQDNQSLPHRFATPAKARKTIGSDGRWEFPIDNPNGEKQYKSWPMGEIITNIDSTRWQLGVNGEEEEWIFENSCNRIAAAFGCRCEFCQRIVNHAPVIEITVTPVYADH